MESTLVKIKTLQQLQRWDFEANFTLKNINFGVSKAALLQKVVSIVKEKIIPAVECPEKMINYVGLSHILSHIGELVDFYPVKGSEILSASPKFKQGDILMGRMRPYLNKVWLAEFDGVCSGEIIVLRPDINQVDPYFLQAILLSQITLAQILPLQSGSSRPRVSASDVISIKVPIPKDLKRQAEIAKVMREAYVNRRQKLAEAENLITEAKARVERLILGEEDVP